MIASTQGVFGRQARYQHGPLPVVLTAHPASHDYLQLASQASKLNLLQYLFSPGVQGVLADRQLPAWVGSYVPRRVAHRAQVVRLAGGAQLIVQLRRDASGASLDQAQTQQIHTHLWLVQRTTAQVEATPVLNFNLEFAGQLLNSHRDQDLSRYSTATVEALRSSRRACFAQLLAHLRTRLGFEEQQRALVQVVLCRLLLAHRVGVDLAGGPWSGDTQLQWGAQGVGYVPPLPPEAGAFAALREVA